MSFDPDELGPGFAWDILQALTADIGLNSVLQTCAQAMVRHFGAAFARVWTLPPGSQVLELKASAGMYTHIDGPHARVPLGSFKIGLIASERRAHITNDVLNDPRVGDPAWARREGMIAFAGYPLVYNGKTVGVAAMFSQRPIPERIIHIFSVTASRLATRIAQFQMQLELEHFSQQLQRRNAQLAAATLKAELLLESVPNGILIVNEAGTIMLVNEPAENMFGYRREELMGQSAEILIPGSVEEGHPLRSTEFKNLSFEDRSRIRAMFAGLDSHVVRKDGSEFPVQIALNPIQTETENSILCSIVDITDRKLAENKIIEAARMKADFLANMSHEIRTPMNVLIGMSGLLLDTNLDPDQRDCAETIRKGAQSLLVVINDTLDFSKIEAGKLNIDPVDFNVDELAEDVTEFLVHQASDKGLQLSCSVALDVPPVVRGDSARVRQILTNLVGNAIKFTRSGEVSICVSLRENPGETVLLRFEVRDTGIGIAKEAQSRLFKPFSQADGSTTRIYGGTGLGLAICKRLAELMSGSIGLDSEIGKGSSFWVDLPFDVRKELKAPASSGTLNLSGSRILVVASSVSDRAYLQRHLLNLNADVDAACHARQAITLLRQSASEGKPYQAVLLDYHLSDGDGTSLIRLIKPEMLSGSAKLILLLSAHERAEFRNLREWGISSLLVKPVRRSQLFRSVETLAVPVAPVAPAAPKVSRASSATTILLVEDNPLNQKLAVRLLQKHGYAFDVANNGAEALERFFSRNYSLVLMDCQMPLMDGFQATAAIRERDGNARRTPIIALTAHSMQGYREKCLQAGMDDHISKPIHERTLVETIERWSSYARSGAAIEHSDMASQNLMALSSLHTEHDSSVASSR